MKGTTVYVLIERNNDGCFMETSLVAASDNHKELEERMAERYQEALNDAFSYILPLTDADMDYCSIDYAYASIGCDGNGEMCEWYIFDTDNKDTWRTTC